MVEFPTTTCSPSCRLRIVLVGCCYSLATIHAWWPALGQRMAGGCNWIKKGETRHHGSARRPFLVVLEAKSSPLSQSDQDRLVMGDVGMTAFIEAEMRHFVNQTMVEFDQGLQYGIKWTMPLDEKVRANLVDDGGEIVNEDYRQALQSFHSTEGGERAVDLICNTTYTIFIEAMEQQEGLLSALGSAILYFRNFYRTPTLIAACERIGLSDYAVAHHITDMYHHRSFRGAYTKTLAASGKGEIAARIAVGLEVEDVGSTSPLQDRKSSEEDEHGDDDECMLWSPTTPGVCVHWKSADEAWRKTRFERIQMEGTKDPRRGGSSTSR